MPFTTCTRVLPYIWKCTAVTPVFKMDILKTQSITYHYQYVSHACAIKITESTIKYDLLHYLLKQKLISKQQHRFLAKHSTVTVTNLLARINDWTLFIKHRIVLV